MVPGCSPARWCVAVVCLAAAGLARAQAPPEAPPLTLREAVAQALQHNPELAAQRQARGIAAAGVVLARAYPHNPLLDVTARAAIGTPDAGVLQHVPVSASVLQELEIHGQGQHRRAAAAAALTRAEWEVAAQELAMALRAVRAFKSLVFHEEKLRLFEDAVRNTEQAVTDMVELQKKDKDKVPPGELVLIRFEVQEARVQALNGRGPREAARQELLRVLGAAGARDVRVTGALDMPLMELNEDQLLGRALTLRPDLRARQAALAEAEGKLRLERAGRWGNPYLGPAFEVNESKAVFVGATLTVPLPVWNRRQGEVQQRQAELARAGLELRQAEAEVTRDVRSALARHRQIEELIELYRKDYLPALQSRLEDLYQLYRKGDPGVDLQQVLELRRRLLKARENYLDALHEHWQIEVDVAAAVGDVELAFGPGGAAGRGGR